VTAGFSITPTPTDEEAAAIAAAVEFAWPRPVVVLADNGPATPAWRFSGRWWARPVAVRRDRPFY
jgi:hypothetical protein